MIGECVIELQLPPPVAPAKRPFATHVASDGLRIGLGIPFFPDAKTWAKRWGGAWSFGSRMWVFSNDDFKRRVLPGLDEALTAQPTFHADGLRDLAADAWRNADHEQFVARLDAQMIPLETGGHHPDGDRELPHRVDQAETA